MTLRALIIGVLLSLLGIVWIHQASLMQSPWNPYAFVYLLSVPPVPAVVFLFVLAVGAGLWRRLRLRPLASRELATVYVILTLAIPATTFGIIEMMLPWPNAPVYFGTPQNGLTEIADQYFPHWMLPQDTEVVRTMFEGADDGRVPWRAWALPLLGWTGLSGLVFVGSMCLVSLFHKQWAEHEHLRYPLLLLPLSVTDSRSSHSEVRGVFRNPQTWIAIGLVFLHHAMNIAHLYNPAVMALMDRYRVGQFFTERPWTAFSGLVFMHRPQMIGFSYFVSVDVLFSGWFFFVVQSAMRVVADMVGYQGPSGFPFAPQQGAGAFTAAFLTLVWVGKDHLRGVLQRAVGGLSQPSGGGAQAGSHGPPADGFASQPRLVWGAVACFGVLIWWCARMNMAPWLALAFFGMIVAWAVVYARIRAEAGVASMWALPFVQHLETITNAVGTRGLITGSNASNLVMLTMFGWMSHGYFPSLTGTVAENNKLAQDTGLGSQTLPLVMLLAFVVGMAGGYVVTLGSYYREGANVLHGGVASGGYTVSSAMGRWNGVANALRSPGGPDLPAVGGAVAGGVIALAIAVARRVWLRFPFHPLGYAMALNYGYCLWGPFLIAWLLKLIIDRLGGAQLYHRLMPFFLGLVIGDLLAGGLIWILLAAFGSEITRGYVVQFG